MSIIADDPTSFVWLPSYIVRRLIAQAVDNVVFVDLVVSVSFWALSSSSFALGA